MIAVLSLLVVAGIFVTATRLGDQTRLQAVEEQHQLVEEITETND